jgi:hypothetical protein
MRHSREASIPTQASRRIEICLNFTYTNSAKGIIICGCHHVAFLRGNHGKNADVDSIYSLYAAPRRLSDDCSDIHRPVQQGKNREKQGGKVGALQTMNELRAVCAARKCHIYAKQSHQ